MILNFTPAASALYTSLLAASSNYVPPSNIGFSPLSALQSVALNLEIEAFSQSAYYIDTNRLRASAARSARSMFERSIRRADLDLTTEEASIAETAMSDAVRFLAEIDCQVQPFAYVTDEGIAILKWQGKSGGVILLFSGDKQVTLSNKSSFGHYSESAVDLPLNSDSAVLISNQINSLEI